MKETPAHDPDQANWLHPLYFGVGLAILLLTLAPPVRDYLRLPA